MVGGVMSRPARRRGDAIFRAVTLGAGLLVLAILAAITVFLIVKAIPAFQHDKHNFLTTKQWDPDGSKIFGVAALAFGTLLSSLLALVIAVPIAVGVALYITQYAPRRLAAPLAYATDLLAAVPSVVFGLWGVIVLLPHLVGVQKFLATYFGWIPLFSDPHGQAAQFSKSIFGASVVLAIMILPIIAAVSREVLRQGDPSHREAALALGATRWEMIRYAVLPPAKSGIVSATMLGLGRALGETIAVALVIGAKYDVNWHVLQPGGNTIAANIANFFGEAGSLGRSALIASGLVLFGITLVVNLVARWVLYRSGRQEWATAV